MKLKNKLYKIISKNLTGSSVFYNILLKADHQIYQVHFPGEPITPGVCIIQIGEELIEDYMGQEYQLQFVKNVKFLRTISPQEFPQVTYAIDKIVFDESSKTCSVQVQVLSSISALAKLSLIFKQQ